MYSCSKDNRPYELVVRAIANDSIVAQNAQIRVYAPVEGTFIDYYSQTDVNGEASFKFTNKAVLEIYAGKGPFKGCSYAELEKGVVTVTVNMLYYNDPKNGCDL